MKLMLSFIQVMACVEVISELRSYGISSTVSCLHVHATLHTNVFHSSLYARTTEVSRYRYLYLVIYHAETPF
jgi:hypothetical protein